MSIKASFAVVLPNLSLLAGSENCTHNLFRGFYSPKRTNHKLTHVIIGKEDQANVVLQALGLHSIENCLFNLKTPKTQDCDDVKTEECLPK